LPGAAVLAASIAENGLEQPITVRPRGRGAFWIVLGERRWRAHKALVERGLRKFATIECRVKNYKEGAELRIAQLVENMQRDDMEPMDEARALAHLVDDFDLTPEDIAAKLGLAPFRVRWRLQLLNLAPAIAKMVEDGHLDRQQALEIARVEGHPQQIKFVQLINRGVLVGWKAVRNAADAMNGNTTTADLFGPGAETASAADVRTLRSMEERIDRVIAAMNAGWRNGECIVAHKVSPDRAAVLADKIALVRQTLATMERELRNVGAQVTIALAS
jgi:ParB family chromosome partitioning protein